MSGATADIPQDLLAAIKALTALQDDKYALDQFEKKICRRIEHTLTTLEKEIAAELKAVQNQTGNDWSPYLDDFDTWRWDPGDFQSCIAGWLKAEIKSASQKLP